MTSLKKHIVVQYRSARRAFQLQLYFFCKCNNYGRRAAAGSIAPESMHSHFWNAICALSRSVHASCHHHAWFDLRLLLMGYPDYGGSCSNRFIPFIIIQHAHKKQFIFISVLLTTTTTTTGCILHLRTNVITTTTLYCYMCNVFPRVLSSWYISHLLMRY